MKITKQRLACMLTNAIDMLDEIGVDVRDIKKEIGITDEEMLAIGQGNVEEGLAPEERFKIAREVEVEDKLQDIETRVRELWDGESTYLYGFTAEQIISNKKLMNNIFARYERALGWTDNSSYWNLLDDCIKEEVNKESTRNLLAIMKNGG